jgi:hypothetical protein
VVRPLRSRLRRLPALAPGLLLAAGCEREPTRIELPDDQVTVQSVLVAGADTVRLILARTGYDPVSRQVVGEAIVGAHVEVTGGGQVLLLESAPPGVICLRAASWGWWGDDVAQPGCYVGVLPGGVQAGTEYELRAILPDGAIVRGRALVPDPPEILAPPPGARVPGTWTHTLAPGLIGQLPLRLEWAAREGTAGIGLVGSLGAAFYQGEPQTWPGCRLTRPRQTAFHGSATSADWDLAVVDCLLRLEPDGHAVIPDSVAVVLTVVAQDTGYTRYQASGWGESIRIADVSIGLDGAVGVFAGIAPSRRSIILYADHDQ